MEPSEQLHFTLYNTCNLSKATHNKLRAGKLYFDITLPFMHPSVLATLNKKV